MPLHGRVTNDEIRRAMSARGLTQEGLGEALGLDQVKVSKSLNGTRRWQHQEMDAIRSLLLEATTPEQLPVRRIPLLGDVPAGHFRDAFRAASGSVIVPDDIPPNCYALDPVGDSMDLVATGKRVRIIVDPDDLDVYPERYYVVKNPEGETTFKQFMLDPARLVPCSSNEAHKDILIGRAGFEIVGRVIAIYNRL
jgi:repressor LexA